MDTLKRLVERINRWTERHRLPRISRRAIEGFLSHDALQYAGGMAYFSVLAIFQLLVLGVVLASLILGADEARQFVVDQVSAGSPVDPEMVGEIIDSAIEARGEVTILTIVFLAWGALGLFGAMSGGIARVFDVAEPRPFIKQQVLGLTLMALTGLLAVGSVVIGIATGILVEFATELVAGVPGGETAVRLIGFLVPLILIFIAFWVIYRVVPNRPVAWGEVLPGAIVATLLWTVLRIGFTFYATRIANYDSAFGPLSTAITLIVFLYFASLIILIGAEFARARTLDNERELLEAADPRFLPVAIDVPPGPAPVSGKGISRWVVLAGAAVLGVLIGRLTKRDEY